MFPYGLVGPPEQKQGVPGPTPAVLLPNSSSPSSSWVTVVSPCPSAAQSQTEGTSTTARRKRKAEKENLKHQMEAKNFTAHPVTEAINHNTEFVLLCIHGRVRGGTSKLVTYTDSVVTDRCLLMCAVFCWELSF